MTAMLVAILALSGLAFGMLGYFTGKKHKPEQKYQLIITVAFCLVLATVDVLSGFKIGMSHILGPWLIGVGVGFLRRT
jgi:hypothetical protein